MAAIDKIIKADNFFAKGEDEIFIQRSELERAYKQKEKLWVCPICRQPVIIRGKEGGIISMHFAHVADKLDCPIKTGRNYTKDEILRMKYNGQKESPRHHQLKTLIAEKISRDGRFTNIKIEKRFEGICKDWRKPDVSAIYNGKRIVFELQISTTFLSIIAERNLFYQQNDTYIIWIFDNKRDHIEKMRFMEKDIFYPNFHNAFFLDENTDADQFKLICGYEEPIIFNGSIKNDWRVKEIDFDELKFDLNFRVYWFDYEEKKKLLQVEIEKKKYLDFGELWLQTNTEEDRLNLLDNFNHIFKQQNEACNFFELSNLLSCLYSVKFKKVIGYNYNKLIQLLHQYFMKEIIKRDHFGEYIFKAIRVYGARNQIIQEDKTEKFKNKAIAYNKMKFKLSHKYDSLLIHLFPELWE